MCEDIHCCPLACCKPLLSTYVSNTTVHENDHPMISDGKLIDKHIRLEMAVTKHPFLAFVQGHRYKGWVIQSFDDLLLTWTGLSTNKLGITDEVKCWGNYVRSLWSTFSEYSSLKSLRPSDAYIYTSENYPSLVQIIACRLAGARPLSNQCWNIINWTLGNKVQWNLNRIHIFPFKKVRLKMSRNWRTFCFGLNVLN